MTRFKHAILLLAILVTASTRSGSAQSTTSAALDCKAGPVTKTYGKSPWLVYACNDGHSLVMVSAPGSKSMPFYFKFQWKDGQYKLSGEGTGNQVATDAAFHEISALNKDDIERLFSEAKAAAAPHP